MLKSAKDRVIGVDTPGQQVPPRVQYGTTCLLIRDAMGSVPCSDEWEIDVVTHLGSHGARGVMVLLLALLLVQACHGKPYHCYGTATSLAKSGIRSIVNLCNDM
jgi:hypothetical protein